MTDSIRTAADRLWRAAESKEPCAPVRDLIGELEIGEAYQVQEINTARRLEAGRRLVGRKTGLTAKAVQACSRTVSYTAR